LHSKQPCCSGEDAPSVAKDIARPTLHQIAEWPEQTAGASGPTNAINPERARCWKNIEKTWNFMRCAAVGLFKQLELIAFPLTINDQVIPAYFQQGNSHGHNSYRNSDLVADRWIAGLPALQKLGLWPIGHHWRRVGRAVGLALARQNMKI
jgi:hypothetical protein